MIPTLACPIQGTGAGQPQGDMPSNTDKRRWHRDQDYEKIAHDRIVEAARAAPEMLNFTVNEWQNEIGFPQAYRLGPAESPHLFALVGREPVSPVTDKVSDLRWHISVNGGIRLPTWHEMVDAGHQLRPGVCFVIGVPPKSWWMADIKSGKYVLHLWQLKDNNLEQSWLTQRTPGGRAPS